MMRVIFVLSAVLIGASACTPTTHTALQPGASVAYSGETCVVATAPAGGEVTLDCPARGRVSAPVSPDPSAPNSAYAQCLLEQELERRARGQLRGAALRAVGLNEAYGALRRAQRLARLVEGGPRDGRPDPCAHLL